MKGAFTITVKVLCRNKKIKGILRTEQKSILSIFTYMYSTVLSGFSNLRLDLCYLSVTNIFILLGTRNEMLTDVELNVVLFRLMKTCVIYPSDPRFTSINYSIVVYSSTTGYVPSFVSFNSEKVIAFSSDLL